MRSRRHEEEHENHERWLVSYADFITLLFAFFVVMYSVSSVNEGKFRVLSSSMEDAFHEHPLRGLEPIQIGEILRTLDPEKQIRTGEGILPDYEPKTDYESPNEGQDEIPEGYEAGEEIVEDLKGAAQKLEDAGFKVDLNEKWVEVSMSSEVLFTSGRARLSKKAAPALDELVSVLNEFKNPLKVEGFTDDRPIRTAAFPSNWELSAARAASVVSHFTQQNIDPKRMAAVGYGEHRPFAENSTAEGRSANRRIVIKISTDASELQADAEQNTEVKNEPVSIFLHTIEFPGPDGFEL
ncbi:MAG: flagellar motor protein MotD [Gammaproteobacteria bacterium]